MGREYGREELREAIDVMRGKMLGELLERKMYSMICETISDILEVMQDQGGISGGALDEMLDVIKRAISVIYKETVEITRRVDDDKCIEVTFSVNGEDLIEMRGIGKPSKGDPIDRKREIVRRMEQELEAMKKDID